MDKKQFFFVYFAAFFFVLQSTIFSHDEVL